MSRKANPTVIGSFVVGAVVVLVAAVAIFGSGKFLSHRPRAVAFFQGSVQGLSVGSAVNLRGVQIGQVSNIILRLDTKTMNPIIYVYMEFEPKRLKVSGGFTAEDISDQQPLRTAIANGLHARLVTQSMVTGQLLVELALNPNEPRHLLGADPETVEIPTSESDLEKLKTALTKLPLDEIANTALEVLEGADRILKSDEIPQVLRDLSSAGGNLDKLLSEVHADLPPLVSEVNDTARSARDTLAAAQAALTELRTTLGTADRLLATDVREAVRVATAALQKADKTLADADSLLVNGSPQRYDIDQTLRNLSAATRALRVFAEDVERRPNSLVVGK